MIIPTDDKKPPVEPRQESQDVQPAEQLESVLLKRQAASSLARDLTRDDHAQLANQFSSLNPYRSTSIRETSPPRYEDVASRVSDPGPSTSTSGADAQRPSIQPRSSDISDMDKKDPMSLAALEASPAFQPDGRFQVSIDTRPSELPANYANPVHEPAIDLSGFQSAPPLNINIMIVGSRGDVQPYLALGQRLVEHGHTVRLTTHETFRQSVKDAGLRFFNIGGNPHELMSYMVRNPGLMPGFDSLTNGDITRKQMMIAEMLERCWRSCYEPDEASEGSRSFAADAIISNPPTFAHIHCAEALAIPLLMSFTMPWTPTTAFPHPLVNVQHTSAEPRMTNYLTYGLADMMTWQGLGHTINKFRRKRLALPPLSVVSGAGTLERCNVPWTFCISPALVPKPEDWMNHIDVAGFYFLDLAKDYTPPPELEAFLNAGPTPIYIGFGSIVVKDRAELTNTVLAAVAQSGLRAVISAGWGSLDAKIMSDPTVLKNAGNPDIFVLGNVPHDWLFERVGAVCHHGGAGTTAAGLRCGKPTIVIPFFGDQPWWGAQIHARNAGPAPIPLKQLSTKVLAAAFEHVMREDVQGNAQTVGELIQNEASEFQSFDGVGNGVDSFHRHLPLMNMRCELDANRVAVWYSATHGLRLSAFAAQTLAEYGLIDLNKLTLHRPREYHTRDNQSGVVSGTMAPLLGMVGDLGMGVGQLLSAHPEKGVVRLVKAVPDGLRNSLEGLHQGLKHSPKIYGGSVREGQKVTGFKSGMKEGGKELFYGFYDGMTDIVKEPVKGFKQGGVMGGVNGAVAGLVNSVVKPAAGIVGLFSQPIEGTAASTRAFIAKPAKERHATRYAEGIAAFKLSTEAERKWVLNAFEAKGKGKGKGKQKAITQGE